MSRRNTAMNKTILSIFVVILTTAHLTNAQIDSGAFWGLSYDVNCLLTNNYNKLDFNILPPVDFYLHLGYKFNNNMQVEIYGSYIFLADNWDGPDIGFNLKHPILNKVYLIAGISYYYLSGESGAGGHLPHYYIKDFINGDLGVGFFVTKIAFAEIEFELPLNSDRTYGMDYNNYFVLNERLILISKLKLNFGWNFSF